MKRCIHCKRIIKLVSKADIPGEADLWIHVDDRMMNCGLFATPEEA